MKEPRVYILASQPNGVLYIGVTSDLHCRMAVHDQGLIEGFTKRYGVKCPVYYEFHESMEAAIGREKEAEGVAARLEGAPHRKHESGVGQPL